MFAGKPLCLIALALGAGDASAAPHLHDLLAAAREQAVAGAEARGELGVARAGVVGARQSVFQNPYLEVQLDHGHLTRDVAVSAFVALPVEISGQRGARIRENEALTRWKLAAAQQAELDVESEVVARWGALLVSEARMAIAARAADDARAQANDIAERLRVGDATIVDSSEAEAEVVRWAMLQAEGELARIAARTTLAELTGIALTEAVLEAPTAPVPPTRERDDWVEVALREVPALRVLAEERQWLLARRTRYGKERFLPLSFIVNAGRGDGGESRGGGGLAYTFPVTHRYQGEIAEAEAEARRVDAVLARVRRVVTARANGSTAVLTRALEAVRAQETAGIPTAARLVDAAYESYRAGKGELLRVLIGRRDLAVARDRRLDFVAHAWQAYAELVALGAVRP